MSKIKLVKKIKCQKTAIRTAIKRGDVAVMVRNAQILARLTKIQTWK